MDSLGDNHCVDAELTAPQERCRRSPTKGPVRFSGWPDAVPRPLKSSQRPNSVGDPERLPDDVCISRGSFWR